MRLMKNNLRKCKNCNYDIIDEEENSHVCFTGKIIEYYFDTSDPSSVMVFDGKNHFTLPIAFLRIILKTTHQPKVNTNNITDKETEPSR